MGRMIYRGWVIATVIIACLFVTGIAFFTVGPFIERTYFPVVTGTPLLLDYDQHEIRFGVFGRKIRDCELTGIHADVKIDGKWFRADIKFKDLESGKYRELRSSRPQGAQLWDLYVVKPVGTDVRAFVTERCHPFWASHTDFFEMNLQEAVERQVVLPLQKIGK